MSGACQRMPTLSPSHTAHAASAALRTSLRNQGTAPVPAREPRCIGGLGTEMPMVLEAPGHHWEPAAAEVLVPIQLTGAKRRTIPPGCGWYARCGGDERRVAAGAAGGGDGGRQTVRRGASWVAPECHMPNAEDRRGWRVRTRVVVHSGWLKKRGDVRQKTHL